MIESLTASQKDLLDNLLNALDDLYDSRDQAELWSWRLFAATSEAVRNTVWHDPIQTAATQLFEIICSDLDADFRHEAALAATGELRLLLADQYEENWLGSGRQPFL
jgi:hypothetical protein